MGFCHWVPSSGAQGICCLFSPDHTGPSVPGLRALLLLETPTTSGSLYTLVGGSWGFATYLCFVFIVLFKKDKSPCPW